MLNPNRPQWARIYIYIYIYLITFFDPVEYLFFDSIFFDPLPYGAFPAVG